MASISDPPDSAVFLLHGLPLVSFLSTITVISFLLSLIPTHFNPPLTRGLQCHHGFTHFVVWNKKIWQSRNFCNILSPLFFYFLSTTPNRLPNWFLWFLLSVVPREIRKGEIWDVLASGPYHLIRGIDLLQPRLFLRFCSLALFTNNSTIRCALIPWWEMSLALKHNNNKHTACGDEFLDKLCVDQRCWYLTHTELARRYSRSLGFGISSIYYQPWCFFSYFFVACFWNGSHATSRLPKGCVDKQISVRINLWREANKNLIV